jgi:hypothetical protein
MMKNPKSLLQFLCFALFIYILTLNNFAADDGEFQNFEKTCANFPKDVVTDNMIWQVMETPRGFVKILNAYLDTRFNTSLVRINVSSHKLNITKDSIYCQFWYDNMREARIVKATEFILMWFKG